MLVFIATLVFEQLYQTIFGHSSGTIYSLIVRCISSKSFWYVVEKLFGNKFYELRIHDKKIAMPNFK